MSHVSAVVVHFRVFVVRYGQVFHRGSAVSVSNACSSGGGGVLGSCDSDMWLYVPHECAI